MTVSSYRAPERYMLHVFKKFMNFKLFDEDILNGIEISCVVKADLIAVVFWILLKVIYEIIFQIRLYFFVVFPKFFILNGFVFLDQLLERISEM